MTTSETAQFIQDRALSLRYEVARFHATADVTLSWLGRATTWAWQHDHKQLAAHLHLVLAMARSSRR